MTTMHGFELLREQEIPELKSRALLFRHVKTGAQLLALENDDENKVFGITFRTPPPDATGVAHILEHAVLCGSRKYRVKEPFVELVKGSLNTFLNAFTYPDKTCYPVASQNLKDFYNLIEVYLDAVFYPLIPPQTLQQEGWHYEVENGTLHYKGVVFNEMKGSYASPERLLAEYTQQSLFPGHVYGLDSGGHPRHIPALTYAQFKAFHETYYHPSNARIFFYGDDPTPERLRLINEYLKDFEYKPVASEIPPPARWQAPRRAVHVYDAGQETGTGRKGMVTVNWLLTDNKDPETTLALSILAHALIGTPAAPLYKALIDSGLGEDIAGAGLEAELREMYFSTGLKGIAPADADKVEELILATLQRLVREGFDSGTIAAALNTIEFHLREKNTGSYPRGLVVMLSALTTWLYDGDPLAPLGFEAPLAAIKAKLAAHPRFFEELVQRHLLDNAHRSTVLLQPQAGLAEQEEAAERERLAAIQAQLSAAEMEGIIAQAAELKRRQETPDPPEELAKLPVLQREDLDRKIRTIPQVTLAYHGTPVLYHELFTNGIIYFDLGFNLHLLPPHLLPYVSLFSRALLEMGTEQADFVKLLQRIGCKTGGIRATSFISMRQHQSGSLSWLFLRGKAMRAQWDDLLAILRDVLLTVRLDNQERFRQMVLDEKAGQEAGLVPAGHRVVGSRLQACFNEAGWANEEMDGVNYLFFLRQLAQEVDANWPAVLARLEEIRRRLVNRNGMLCNLTLEEKDWRACEPGLYAFLDSLPQAQATPVDWSPRLNHGFEGLTIPAQVNYVGKAANLYRLGYAFHGSVLVITNFLRTTWLWERVRMQGGAYGGFCSFGRHSGVFSFLSYRDPNLLATIENYDRAGEFLAQVSLPPQELTKSIIGTIGDLDAYQLPDAKGYTAMIRHLLGDTDELRQRIRDQVLDTTARDFRAFAEVLAAVKDNGLVVVMGSPAAINEVNAARNNWLRVTKVL
ncbi:MAG: insulinase family protein [candidate division KSB1 bacterium]|nr:insulinase family protein [candidate division KSB1 bacterium]MDZ7275580.1 insulinase family protein [candidate division KSB1 bacterium]MDZ7284729.1 insulinase family protein [candidate division KSB1 bacterium]MDZ7297852.1 insulinase family protein [candidate division KSB1 bacterium]MDZ7308756.1 insulinase family protein [candidate division KSB1 bacterium]